MNIKLLIEIHNQANKIFNSDLSWEQKYDFIFSENISKVVFRELGLSYYDPDTSYEEDVTAFMTAFNEKFEMFEKTFLT